ncbi:TPA: hypothetical protein ACVU4L_004185 [Vibrio parahaemolyticus]
MTKKLLIATLLASTMSLTGCGALIGMQASSGQFAMTRVTPLTEVEPVKSDVFKHVQSVGIVYYVDKLKDSGNYPEDNIAIYKLMAKYTQKNVESIKKFKVIDRNTFENALNKVAPDLDIFAADPEEYNEAMAKVGRYLGVHALIDLQLEEAHGNITSVSNQLVMAKDLIVHGSARIPMNLTLKMIRSRNGEELYSQNDLINWEMGTSGLANMSQKDLHKAVNNAVKPLVEDMGSYL